MARGSHYTASYNDWGVIIRHLIMTWESFLGGVILWRYTGIRTPDRCGESQRLTSIVKFPF